MSDGQKSLGGDYSKDNKSSSSNFSGDFKRFTALEKKIEDVTPEDIRVRISGIVINREESSLLLDDGSGTVRVMGVYDELKTNRIRVIGKVMPSEDGWTLQAEAVHEWDCDPELYNEVQEIIAKTPYF